MNKFMLGMPLLLVFPALLPLACKSASSPASPGGQGSGPTWTFTPSPTATSTPTVTPTPNCLDATPIATTSINGPDIQGNDANDLPPMDLDGYGPRGDVYAFTLSSPTTLNFSLCPTDDVTRDTVMMVRSGYCWSPDSAFDDDTNCGDYLSEITGFPATQVGTPYYLIVAENSGSTAGPYLLRIKSGELTGPVCTVTPVSTPQAVSPGQHLNCSAAYDLGNGSQLPAGDSVVTGYLNDNVDTDDYYSFIPADSGTATVTLDCYDNGLGQADFEIIANGGCSASGADENYIFGSTAPSVTLQTFTFQVVGGTIYYIDVYDYFGCGTYRLTVQTP